MVQHPQPQSVDYANQYLYHALTIGEMMLCCGAEVGRVALVCAADVPPGVESAMALLQRGLPR